MHLSMKIRRVLVFSIMSFLLLCSTSCKKAVEEQYDDVLKKLITDGSWVITKFTEVGVDITGSFGGWVCKFYDNNTLTATQGLTVQSGTWQSNSTSQTISAQFNSSVTAPLDKINGTWTISATSATVGKFTQTKAGVAYTMELTKN
jgi:hypothetical protein